MMNNTQKAEHIVKWIKEYVSNMPTPAKALCVNCSGGVDSSLVSTLCAMTGLKTIALSLPLRSKPESHNLSIKHQEWLKKKFKNIECHVINLDTVYESFKKTLSKFDHKLGLVNSKARLRMVTIYQVAAKNEGIVVGTGNAVEDFAIGFFSKGGDGQVDISPIGDLTKTEVWSLAEHLEILDEIIKAEPTDGLWESQTGHTDVAQIGLTYSELEKAIKNPEDKNHQKYLEIRKRNLHKMQPIPVCKMDD